MFIIRLWPGAAGIISEGLSSAVTRHRSPGRWGEATYQPFRPKVGWDRRDLLKTECLPPLPTSWRRGRSAQAGRCLLNAKSPPNGRLGDASLLRLARIPAGGDRLLASPRIWRSINHKIHERLEKMIYFAGAGSPTSWLSFSAASGFTHFTREIKFIKAGLSGFTLNRFLSACTTLA